MRYLPLLLTAASFCALTAQAELELKSVALDGQGVAVKRKYGPYVGVSAGEALGQKGRVSAGGRGNLSLNDSEGSAIFSIEVGKSWKMKKLPLQASVDVEGTFMSTNLQGKSNTAGLAADDVAEYEADMNSLFFTVNGSIALDLYRYRARIGKVLAGFRPYVGAGLGGGQVWYRNATSRSASQVNGGTTAPSSTPFSIDEFTHAWNWYAGLEWTWKDQYSIFAEYRDFHLGDLEDMKDYSTSGYLVGFRYRY